MASSSSSQYPHPSMINVGNFVSIKLTKTNYPLWKAQMRSLIVSQNLVGFIDGQNVAPPQSIIVQPDVRSELIDVIGNPEYQAWSRTDWLLKGWIIGSLSEEVLGLVVMSDLDSDSYTARVVWDRLAKAFDQKPKPEIQLQKVKKTKTEQEIKIEELIDAIKSGQRFSIVKNLVESMSSQELAHQDEETGFTALHRIAIVGNVQVAKLLVKKAPLLPNIKDSGFWLPLHFAASFSRREMTSYLMEEVAKDEKKTKPFEGYSGVTLMRTVMTAKFYGVALDLLQKNRELAWQEFYVSRDPSDVALDLLKDEDDSASQPRNALEFMAQDPSSFPSGRCMNILQRLIYSCAFVKLEHLPNHPSGGDMEKRVQIIKEKIMSVFRNLHGVVWEALEILVPWIKDIRYTKLMHHEALELFKYLCNQAKEEDVELLESPLLFGAQHGIHEVVEEILNLYKRKDIFGFVDMPKEIFKLVNKENHNVFHLAVMYHREKVFNILYQYVHDHRLPTAHVQRVPFTAYRDQNGNNVLHLAGHMARRDRLDLVSGGVLQLQRDLQWFKEVEKLVANRNMKNKEGKTPLMIFNEEHEKLVTSESQWVQGMANSCTLAASLVATVVFAAAITVPGGNSNNGVPIFSTERAFIIFAISDALALFSSVSSVLSFLSVLTSRYEVIDFLHTLPQRLIIGLVTLFISVTSVIIAFSAALYLVFGQRKAWFLILVSTMACLPVTLFMFMQLPLLLDMIKSTYGPGIIRKPSERASFGLRRKMQEFGASICNSVRRIKFLK